MNVLCVMAHPDDEVLGCGGTLAKHAEAGDLVSVQILAERGLYDQILAARDVLGYKEIWTDGTDEFPDQRFDTVPFVRLTEEIGWSEADIVYTHHPGDLNLDHALTARAVLTAFRPKPGEKPRTILACEVLSSTEWTFPQVFQPNWFESVNGWQMEKKELALDCYPSEVKSIPHPRSAEGIWNLARVRGSQCGVDYAEAFQLLRRSC